MDRYTAANAAFDAYWPTYEAARKAHQAREISSEEYMAARKERDRLMAEIDAAQAAL